MICVCLSCFYIWHSDCSNKNKSTNWNRRWRSRQLRVHEMIFCIHEKLGWGPNATYGGVHASNLTLELSDNALLFANTCWRSCWPWRTMTSFKVMEMVGIPNYAIVLYLLKWISCKCGWLLTILCRGIVPQTDWCYMSGRFVTVIWMRYFLLVFCRL